VPAGYVKKGDTMRCFALWVVMSLLSACGAPDSPESQVRKAVAQMETAVEARSTSDVLEWLSDSYQDGYGGTRQDASQYLRGYFIANQSIHLLTRVDSVEFPIPEEARVKLSVGMVGREAAGSNDWNLAAELYDFDVTMKQQDAGWKVTYVKWQRATRPTG
jgi:outer membrane biogenesis lipoprotein LolB